MKKEQIMSDYLIFRGIECKSKEALGNYQRNIKRFLEKAKDDLSNIDETYLTQFVNKISNEFSQKSLNNIKPLIKNFVKWRFPDYSIRFRNLDKLCKTKKAQSSYSADEMLTEEQIKKIIETETDLFWKVFWLVFFYGGFRGVDVVRLKWDIVEFQEDETTIIKAFIGKNKKVFYKAIPPEITPLIKKWKGLNNTEWMFPNLKGDNHIHPKSLWVHLTKTSMKALNKKINPYLLRHSLASIKYNEEGSDDSIVANQLGHSKTMKETYLHLSDTALITRSKRVWTNKKEMPVEERDALHKEIEILKKSNLLILETIANSLETGDSKTIRQLISQIKE